jgi:hypothetical protein
VGKGLSKAVKFHPKKLRMAFDFRQPSSHARRNCPWHLGMNAQTPGADTCKWGRGKPDLGLKFV